MFRVILSICVLLGGLSPVYGDTLTVEIDGWAVEPLGEGQALYTGGVATCVGFAALSKDRGVGILAHFWYYDDDPNAIREQGKRSIAHGLRRINEIVKRLEDLDLDPQDFEVHLLGGGFDPGAQDFAMVLRRELAASGFPLTHTNVDLGGNRIRSLRLTLDGITPSRSPAGSMLIQ